jgi:hypothetical protein
VSDAAFFVDSWDPAYGASFEASAAGPAAPSSAQVDADAEVPAVDWRAIGVRAGVRAPDVVLLVDGVRRIDASIWTAETDGVSFPGLAASYAAGVVRCDLGRGAAQLAGTRVGRGLFTASPSAQDVVAGAIRYPVHRVGGTGELAKLPAAVQGPLTAVVTGMASGERSPVFRLGTAWGGWSWYLRLPVAVGAPWAGIVRVECSADLPVEAAIELADLSLVTLPRFASTPYKDPRAPQNLIPIAGLERRLRALLGDSRLLHRALTAAARAAR